MLSGVDPQRVIARGKRFDRAVHSIVLQPRLACWLVSR